jgi:hypothetical protein
MNQAVIVEKSKKTSTLGQKGFFVISSEKWDKLFLLHKAEKISIADMAAYLVLACGTGADHKTTSWSAGAVYSHAGISPRPATKSIDRLAAYSFIEINKAAQKNKLPVYKLVFKNDPKKESNQDNIYIPSGVVTGVSGEDSPLKRLVNRQNPHLLYLFIRLYAFQDKFLDCIDLKLVSSAFTGNSGCFVEPDYNEGGLLKVHSDNGTSLSAKYISEFYNFGQPESDDYENPFYFCESSDDGDSEQTGVWGFYRNLFRLGLIQRCAFACRGAFESPDDLDVICELEKSKQIQFLREIQAIAETKTNAFIYDADSIVAMPEITVAILPAKYENVHIQRGYKMTYRTKVGASKAGFLRQKDYDQEMLFLLNKVRVD